jgi:DnaJ-class molecular chaperone
MFDGTASQYEEPELCSSCHGSGQFDVGDPEEGVTETCPECEGSGLAVDYDDFNPKRDAWTPND